MKAPAAKIDVIRGDITTLAFFLGLSSMVSVGFRWHRFVRVRGSARERTGKA
jgi:hypothetical protein